MGALCERVNDPCSNARYTVLVGWLFRRTQVLDCNYCVTVTSGLRWFDRGRLCTCRTELVTEPRIGRGN